MCLAAALQTLSASRHSLLPGANGAPSVPAGFSGSISHKGPIAVAVASDRPEGIGVDLEFAQPSDGRMANRILTTTESLNLGGLSDEQTAMVVARHFAAKEAVYKATPPSEQRDLEFGDIELVLGSKRGDEWISGTACVRGSTSCVVELLFDGKWILAVARQLGMRHEDSV